MCAAGCEILFEVHHVFISKKLKKLKEEENLNSSIYSSILHDLTRSLNCFRIVWFRSVQLCGGKESESSPSFIFVILQQYLLE